ncbi:hypothetical protein Taro_047668, partial [Colocasia esculenta]|nr:hypothetical protein [Colocasia esculenta]
PSRWPPRPGGSFLRLPSLSQSRLQRSGFLLPEGGGLCEGGTQVRPKSPATASPVATSLLPRRQSTAIRESLPSRHPPHSTRRYMIKRQACGPTSNAESLFNL